MASGLTIVDEAKHRAEALSRGRFLVTERLCMTRDGRVVREDECVDGGNLLYPAGVEIPLSEARARGLLPEVEDPLAEPSVPVQMARPEVDLRPSGRRRR